MCTEDVPGLGAVACLACKGKEQHVCIETPARCLTGLCRTLSRLVRITPERSHSVLQARVVPELEMFHPRQCIDQRLADQALRKRRKAGPEPGREDTLEAGSPQEAGFRSGSQRPYLSNPMPAKAGPRRAKKGREGG